MYFPFHYSYDLAHYEPLGQYINLNGYERAKFIGMTQSGVNINNYKSFIPYLHEFRHWLDHIGTVWGQDYMIEIIRYCGAKLTASAFNPSEISPYRINQLLSSHGYLHHIKHSTVTSDSEVWKIRYNVRFVDQVPYFICTVLDYRGEPICYYPVTYVSLFESNARYEEIQCYLDISSLELDQDQRLVENQEVHRQYTYLSYDSNLIEYSIDTAIPSSIWQLDNSIQAYAISSTLNTIILNLTPRMLARLGSNDRLREIGPAHPMLFRNRDFGYILYYLCKLYSPRFNKQRKFVMEEFLGFFDLPDQQAFKSEVIGHMEQNKLALQPTHPFYNYYISRIIYGQFIISQRGIDSKDSSLSKFLHYSHIRPYLIFGDEEWGPIDLSELVTKPIELLNQYEWWTLNRYLSQP